MTTRLTSQLKRAMRRMLKTTMEMRKGSLDKSRKNEVTQTRWQLPQQSIVQLLGSSELQFQTLQSSMASPATKLLAYTSYCITNTANTILPILEDNHVINGDPLRTFYHPLMQTEMMVIGQMLCLLAYSFSKDTKTEEAKSNNRPKAPLRIIIIPVLMDLFASTLQFTAMNYLSGSIYSITSSIVIVSTALFTKLLLKRSFSPNQITGCVLVVLGVVVAGLGECMDDQHPNKQQNQLFLGLGLTLIAFVIEGLEMVVIQIIFIRYNITASQFTGTCGATGTIIWTSILFILSFTGCPFPAYQCVKDLQGISHMQYIPAFLHETIKDPFLLPTVILNILIIARNSYDMSNIISLGNAMIFQIISIFSNGFVWLSGIAITILGAKDYQYKIESLKYDIIVVNLIGFALTTAGLLTYSQVAGVGVYKEVGQIDTESVEDEL